MTDDAQPYCLVICKDGPQGLYTVYFVNESDAAVRSVRLASSGYVTVDDELLQTTEAVKELGQVPAGGHAVVETDDEGAFDFAIGFSVTVQTETESIELEFSVSKYLPAYTPPDADTPLGKPGWVIRPR